ncbi:hypothetical protein GJQ66_11680 [Microbacterium sp. ZXX196]|nr:hypothetical protein [Microbacterium sp. ZXX196]
MVIEELKTRPGQWALVGEDVTTSTATLLKKYGAEATARGSKSGRVARLYARWPEGGAE